MGGFLIPNSSYFLTGGKDGNLLSVEQGRHGRVRAVRHQVQQVVALGNSANMHCQARTTKAARSNSSTYGPRMNRCVAIPFDPGSNLMDPQGRWWPRWRATGQSGAVLSVSSNGSKDGTGLWWASYAATGDAGKASSAPAFCGLDANDVTRELWNNQQNAARDGAGTYAKFSAPTIANGHVYLPTFSSRVVVYGLR